MGKTSALDRKGGSEGLMHGFALMAIHELLSINFSPPGVPLAMEMPFPSFALAITASQQTSLLLISDFNQGLCSHGWAEERDGGRAEEGKREEAEIRRSTMTLSSPSSSLGGRSLPPHQRTGSSSADRRGLVPAQFVLLTHSAAMRPFCRHTLHLPRGCCCPTLDRARVAAAF